MPVVKNLEKDRLESLRAPQKVSQPEAGYCYQWVYLVQDIWLTVKPAVEKFVTKVLEEKL